MSIPLGMLLAAAVAVLAGIPLLKGPQFSIATMAMTECARYIFINWAALGGSSGISISSKKVNKYLYLQPSANSDKVTYYYIVLAVVVALIASPCGWIPPASAITATARSAWRSIVPIRSMCPTA